MPVQTRSTWLKAPAIFDPDTVLFEALSTYEKAVLNLSGKIGFDRPSEGSSVNHENGYYKILKSINKTKFMLRYVNFEPSFKLRWCRARDLFGSQIPVTAGGFELRISCIQSRYLTH